MATIIQSCRFHKTSGASGFLAVRRNDPALDSTKGFLHLFFGSSVKVGRSYTSSDFCFQMRLGAILMLLFQHLFNTC